MDESDLFQDSGQTKHSRLHQTHQLYVLAALSIGMSLAVFQTPEQIDSGVGDALYILSYHRRSGAGSDIIDLVYWKNQEQMYFNMYSSFRVRLDVTVGEYFDGQWKHICGAWKASVGKMTLHFLNSNDGYGDYASNEVTNMRTSEWPAGTPGGSWNLFHEQDEHGGSEPSVSYHERIIKLINISNKSHYTTKSG